MSRLGDRYMTPPPSYPPASMKKQDSVISFISTTTNDDDEPPPDKPWTDECDEILWTTYLGHTNRHMYHVTNITDPSAPPPPPSKLHEIYPGIALQRRICKNASKIFTVNKKQWDHPIEHSVRRLRKLIDDKQEEEGFHIKRELKKERQRMLEREDSDDWRDGSRSRLNYRRSSSPYPHQRRQRSMTPRARLFSGDVASTSDISSPVLFGQQEVLSAPPPILFSKQEKLSIPPPVLFNEQEIVDILFSKQEKLSTPPPVLFNEQEIVDSPPPLSLRDPSALQLEIPPSPRRSARLMNRVDSCVYPTPKSVTPKKSGGQESGVFVRSGTPTPTPGRKAGYSTIAKKVIYIKEPRIKDMYWQSAAITKVRNGRRGKPKKRHL